MEKLHAFKSNPKGPDVVGLFRLKFFNLRIIDI